jgi:hypothetical protein
MKSRTLTILAPALTLLVAAQSYGAAVPAGAAPNDAPPVIRDSCSGMPAMFQEACRAVEQVTAPRDVSTGQSSGKRQHKPI